MTASTSFIGQEEAWREWCAAIGSGRMHHAWLLSGPRGLGKRAFARAAAAELVRHPGQPAPSPLNHPDIIVLDHAPKDDKEAAKRAEGKAYEVKRNVTVDQIRAMQQRLTT
ncbi:MAG: DNA polymerase III subunit delta', partial [Novosphingobium sp.]|nr:DNA polymerase III subunit delta' [Novosphingobium sp.]